MGNLRDTSIHFNDLCHNNYEHGTNNIGTCNGPMMLGVCYELSTEMKA